MHAGLTLSVTRDVDAVRAAQRLRHRVFVREMGAGGGVDPEGDGRESDDFDRDSDHLVLHDANRPDLGVVATLRVARGTRYTEREFDVSALHRSGRSLAEAGRACLLPDYRGGLAGPMLFAGLVAHLRARAVDVAIGTASFPGTDPAPHMPALRRLQIEALAPEAMRPTAHGPGAVTVAGPAPRSAMAGVPALIKTYLRAGALVGSGACVDRAFNTVDVCMVLDLARLTLPGRFE